MKMNRIFYAAKALILGLFTSQILATLQVFLSNVELYRQRTIIAQAGYLTIPNQQVMPSLHQFWPAFYGGFFFTLTVGAGLSVAAIFCAWIWNRLLLRKMARLIPLIFIWLCTVLAMNIHGLCPMPSAYFLLIPPVVFVSALKWMPRQGDKGIWPSALVHIIPLTVLALVWTTQADNHLFLNIRDHLLFSNPVGQKINDFYYRYTLYPAQVFKALDQQTLKTVRIKSVQDKRYLKRIIGLLLRYDYLPVNTQKPVDLELTESEGMLTLKHNEKTVLQNTVKEFLSRPQVVLSDFSKKIDRYAPFRRATIFSLVLGFPIALYIITFALLRLLAGFLLGPFTASGIAAAITLLLGLGLWVPFYIGRITIGEQGVSEALNSQSWPHRVAALRAVVDNGLDIGDFKAYGTLLKSPYIAERYWLAKALGVSRNPKAFTELLTLLDDPHPNVVCMALDSLGQRGQRRAIKDILKRLETSDHWYVQWHAYKALKRLGWRQERVKR